MGKRTHVLNIPCARVKPNKSKVGFGRAYTRANIIAMPM